MWISGKTSDVIRLWKTKKRRHTSSFRLFLRCAWRPVPAELWQYLPPWSFVSSAAKPTAILPSGQTVVFSVRRRILPFTDGQRIISAEKGRHLPATDRLSAFTELTPSTLTRHAPHRPLLSTSIDTPQTNRLQEGNCRQLQRRENPLHLSAQTQRERRPEALNVDLRCYEKVKEFKK